VGRLFSLDAGSAVGIMIYSFKGSKVHSSKRSRKTESTLKEDGRIYVLNVSQDCGRKSLVVGRFWQEAEN